MPGFTPDFARHARLASLSPVGAIRAFIEGAFGMNEESAIAFAIRQDPDVLLSDDEIVDQLAPAMGTDADPQALLDRLRRLSSRL